MSDQNNIEVSGFVSAATAGHKSELRFPEIERAAAKAFSSERDLYVTITNRGAVAELYVITLGGSRYHTTFNYSDTVTALDHESWWENAIRSAWAQIKPDCVGPRI